MKSVIAFSVMTILLLVIVLSHNASTQIAYAQTNSTAADTLPEFNFNCR